jgi:hypothetical protein
MATWIGVYLSIHGHFYRPAAKHLVQLLAPRDALGYRTAVPLSSSVRRPTGGHSTSFGTPH